MPVDSQRRWIHSYQLVLAQSSEQATTTRQRLCRRVMASRALRSWAGLIWCETSTPDLEDARKFAEGVHARFPGKMLAYNCSPSFNWKKHLDDATIAKFQGELGAMGYKFQFITLAGFHSLNLSMFELARGYRESGMSAYSKLQEVEFAREKDAGYQAVKHQRYVGAGYFDDVAQVIAGGELKTTALKGSTEEAQFEPAAAPQRPAKPAQNLPAPAGD